MAAIESQKEEEISAQFFNNLCIRLLEVKKTERFCRILTRPRRADERSANTYCMSIRPICVLRVKKLQAGIVAREVWKGKSCKMGFDTNRRHIDSHIVRRVGGNSDRFHSKSEPIRSNPFDFDS